MYVRRVVLENIRGFETLDFSFDRTTSVHPYAGWTVITGDNASGKTALLKAIAAAMVGPQLIRALQPSFSGWLRAGTHHGEIACELVAGEADTFATGHPYQKPFWSELTLAVSAPNGARAEPQLQTNAARSGKKKGPIHGPWSQDSKGWFFAGYGPFRRLYGTTVEAQRAMLGPSPVARFATLFREDATLQECEAWLKELHHRKLEKDTRAEALHEQLIALLNSDFLHNGLSVERVDSDGVWLRHPGATGPLLALPDMSEGYRSALAMLVDILRHMAEVYGPENLLDESNGHLRVMRDGVVLIDEVDAHLHPSWQREIGFWLTEVFPEVQFIVTTHSPIVCQAAETGGIYHLTPPGDSRPPFRLAEDDCATIKKSPAGEILLTPAFDMEHTRSPEAVRQREKHARLAAKRRKVGLTQDEQSELQMTLAWVDEPDEPSRHA